MLKHLLLRPIAVCTILIVAITLSILAWGTLPISLMPQLEVPYISIAVKYPGHAPADVEQNFLAPLREGMLTLKGLSDIESIAQSESGTVTLRFNYGTAMDLAYIEVNEKIDRLSQFFPSDSERPLAMRAAASDIPIMNIQVTPKISEDLLQASELVDQVIKRRIEQINGIGLVDINGVIEQRISIALDMRKIHALHLSLDYVSNKIQESNIELGSVVVHDGNYRFFLKVVPSLKVIEDLKVLPILLPQGGYVLLNELAEIRQEIEEEQGFHMFMDRRAIVVSVHKQPEARMTDLMPKVYEAVDHFKIDYPMIDFNVTQDQSILLTLSIQNMTGALVWGGAFAFAVLFLFMGNWREPLIMGIVLPVSLSLSFSFFYLFGLSLNVISLSGLALGLGMLVDNSIVVLDSIMIKRHEGEELLTSCVRGTTEVMAPLFSSALTNLAVFVPLIFMSGITGTLFHDQALSVASILLGSLFCTFVLVPLMYLLLFSKRTTLNRDDSRFLTWLRLKYHQSFIFIWRNKKISLTVMVLLFPVALVLYLMLPKESFPHIDRKESLIKIDWNEPIGVYENQIRMQELHELSKPMQSETDAGFRQFIFGLEQYPVQQSTIYMLFDGESVREEVHEKLVELFKKKYPNALYSIENSPNPFEQVFEKKGNILEARFRDIYLKKPMSFTKADSLINFVRDLKTDIKTGRGLEKEIIISVEPDFKRLALNKILVSTLMNELKRIFTNVSITNLRSFRESTNVVFKSPEGGFYEKMESSFLTSLDGFNFPLLDYIHVEYSQDYRCITADQAGLYQSIAFDQPSTALKARQKLEKVALDFNLVFDWAGSWFEDEANRKTLLWIMVVSLSLIYFILTAEFESFKQPILVLSSFPLGLAGSLLLIWITGGSINIMSGIGLVVVLGILDNDAILKIDRINRLRKILPLEEAIIQAGLDRFKPIVMNTLTNILAITPVLFSSGLGADLQRPVALTTIGGLLVATLAAVYFIPLAYWFSAKGKTLPQL